MAKQKKESVEDKEQDSKTDKRESVRIAPLNLRRTKITVYGKNFISARVSDETIAAILEKQTGAVKSGKKKVRDLKKEVKDSMHMTSKGVIGYPAHAFKAGMMDVTSFIGDKFFSRKLIAGAVSIVNHEEGLIPIKYDKIIEFRHRVGVQTLVHPLFLNWSATLELEYDSSNIAPEDLVTCLQYAGHYVGIGAWRAKGRDGGSGEFGRYYITPQG